MGTTQLDDSTEIDSTVLAGPDLRGRRALITGGGTGIGREVAVDLARRGAAVAVSYLTHDAADLVAQIEATGGTACAIQADLRDSDGADLLVETATDRLGGPLDILVNNAGGLLARSTVDVMSDDHWEAVLAVNLDSAFFTTRAVLAHLPDGGRIINIGSLASQSGGGHGAVAYATAKAAIEGFTRALAKELGPRRITVNAIAPGLILDTPFHETFTPKDAQQGAIEATPVARAGYPDDVAAVVSFLASPASAFVTGTVIPVNGGSYFR